MKIHMEISPEQIKLLSEAITHSSLYDKLLKKDDAAWVELKAIVSLANNQVNEGLVRQASYWIIK